MPATGFSSDDLLEACRLYHEPEWTEKERRAEVIYRQEVIERGESEFDTSVDGAIKFLRKWGGLRSYRGGGDKFRVFLPDWIEDNEWALNRLRGKQLHEFGNGREFMLVVYLAGSLWDKSISATLYGKLLHFLLPDAVLLWDQDVVRDGYDLDGDPYSFASYQYFGHRLLRHLTIHEGEDVLGRIQDEHAKVTGYAEPFTKLLDELAYEEYLRDQAVEALGGWGEAFHLAPLLAQILE